MRILLTEGSSLTSRQVAGALARAGHDVGILTSDPLCLARCTRAVRRWHRTPAPGADPFSWLDAAVDAHRTGGYDLLFPTQEQVAVLSRSADELAAAGVATVVPGFGALAAVFDKVAASATLDRLGLPQPPSTTLPDADALARWDRFPVFVKTPVGTAMAGVRHVPDEAARDSLLREWRGTTTFDDGGVLAQEPCAGPLAMVQSVFDHGELVAVHANLRVREGARGGASHKRSTALPAARDVISALGRQLGWHGALSADVIDGKAGAVVIDVNPRLVEPGNAAHAGVDLVGAMLDVAGDGPAGARAPGLVGVRTHQLLLAVLGAAGRGRRAVAGEVAAGLAHRGRYRHSTEELTPLAHDWRAALPVVAATAATLVHPRSASWFTTGSVSTYALSPEAWRQIRRGRGATVA